MHTIIAYGHYGQTGDIALRLLVQITVDAAMPIATAILSSILAYFELPKLRYYRAVVLVYIFWLRNRPLAPASRLLNGTLLLLIPQY